MSRHTPDFRFMCRHKSVNNTWFFFLEFSIFTMREYQSIDQ